MITARAQMLPTTGPTGKAAALEVLTGETVKSAADDGDEL
jgi:hypothetical protein